MAHGIGDDLLDLLGVVAQRAERFRHRLVDDLEVAAASELLELHQREVRLDAGGVAIHDQADRAGRRDDGRLGVAVAVLLAQRDREVPGAAGGNCQVLVLEVGFVECHRNGAQVLVADGCAIGGAAVVAHDPQHVLAVLGEAVERTELLRHLGGGGIGDARHDGRDGSADRAALVAVIGDAGGHEQAADIGEAEAQRAELVGELGDLLGRELRHHHRNLEHHGPQADGMFEGGNVELARHRIAELQQVQGGEVAGRIVEEHIFRTRIRGADLARRRAGVPVVDGGVVLDARVGRGPRRKGNLVPQGGSLDRAGDLAGQPRLQLPVEIALDGEQELVGDANRVVGILAGHGAIGFAIPVGVIGVEFDLGVALLGELDHPLDVVVGNQRLAGVLHGALQRRVLVDLVAVAIGAVAVHAGLHHGLQVLLDGPGAGDEGRNLLLLAHLPFDKFLDVRMVDVDDHHLGGTPGGAARLDGARRAVADLEEAHQARRLAAARQLLVLATQFREVGTGAGAILEQARLAHPQVHDAALVDEVVGNRLDEAGMRLRMLIGRLGLGHAAGVGVDVIMALARTVDAIGPVQAGVEPLRRVGGTLLRGKHEAHLVIEGARVLFGGEVLALPAPVGPRAGKAVEHLGGGTLTHDALLLGQLGERLLVGHRAPQPRGNGLFLDALQRRRNAGLAEILLGENVGRHLAPRRGHVDVLEAKHDRTIGILDFTGGAAEVEFRVGVLTCLGIAAFNAHSLQVPL